MLFSLSSKALQVTNNREWHNHPFVPLSLYLTLYIGESLMKTILIYENTIQLGLQTQFSLQSSC